MSEADCTVAGGLESGVAGAVALESGAVAVEGEAVQLDDQALCRPERVDLVPQDHRVERRERQTVGSTEGCELALEWGSGRGGGAGGRNEATNRTKGSAAWIALADALQGLKLEHVEAVGLLEDMFETMRVDDLGKVEEGARDGGNWDGIVDGPVLDIDLPPMEGDSRPAPAPSMWGRHVDPGATLASKTPEGNCASVAKQRFLTTGKYGGQPMSRLIQPHAPHGIDAAMDLMEPARSQSPLDRAGRKADSQQLGTRHHSVLAEGEARHSSAPL